MAPASVRGTVLEYLNIALSTLQRYRNMLVASADLLTGTIWYQSVRWKPMASTDLRNASARFLNVGAL